jgi:hypothetical protein
MVTMRIAAAWLFLVGVFSLLGALVADVPPGTTVTIFSAISSFASPLILIVGSVQLFIGRFIRTAAFAVSVACAWMIGASASFFWPSTDGRLHYDRTSTLLAVVVFLSAIAVIVIWRSFRHLTMRSSQPLPGEKI